MLLSQTSEYALRAVAYIGVRGEDAPIPAKDLSKATSIPAHYLSKVLRRLVRANILKSTKGHNGGFVLARAARRIKIIDVLEILGEDMPLRHCIFGWRACDGKNPCILHHRWSAVSDAFQAWARTTTIEDIRTDAGSSRWLMSATTDLVKGPSRGSHG